MLPLEYNSSTGQVISRRCGALACFILLVASGGAASASDPITVAWRNKPPYHYFEDNTEKGFLLAKAKKVFESAAIPARFIEEPAKRIWGQFAVGAKSYCSIGWYKLAERESMVQYSTIFYTDRPHVILVGSDAVAKVQAHRHLSSLMADTTLTLGVVDGVSYGPEIDKLIAASKNRIERKTVEPIVMSRMVRANRVNYMFIDEADLLYMRGQEDYVKPLTQAIFPDMPAGLNRHIVCSKDVPAAVMQKLNRAINATR